MDTTVISIRTIQTELDRLRARRQYLRRAVSLLKNDELVDVTTDELSLRMAVHSLNSLITANDVFVERAAAQLLDAVNMYEVISDINDESEKQNVLDSFTEELERLVAEITEQRLSMSDSLYSTREILSHFLEDKGVM